MITCTKQEAHNDIIILSRPDVVVTSAGIFFWKLYVVARGTLNAQHKSAYLRFSLPPLGATYGRQTTNSWGEKYVADRRLMHLINSPCQLPSVRCSFAHITSLLTLHRPCCDGFYWAFWQTFRHMQPVAYMLKASNTEHSHWYD